jgi:hypothetical protein
MKIIEFVKKYQLILVLSFLIIILLILKLIYGSKNESQTSNIIPTPVPTIIQQELTTISNEALNDGNPEYPLQKLMPYSTDNFKILGYDDPFTLIVRNKLGNKTENEKEIRKWIEENLPGDTKHKIIFLD